jgi:hypothetical protein
MVNQETMTMMQTLVVLPKTTEKQVRQAMAAACEAYKDLDVALDLTNYVRDQRYGASSNFQTIDSKMPDVTLGEMLAWVENFTCVQGPELLTQPGGPALDHARARQLYGLMTPVVKAVDEQAQTVCKDPNAPFVLCALAHPRVFCELENLYQRLGELARLEF